MEGSRAILVLVDNEGILESSGHLLSALELLVEAVLLQKAASAQQTGCIGGRVVGETNPEKNVSQCGVEFCTLSDFARVGHGLSTLAGEGTYGQP